MKVLSVIAGLLLAAALAACGGDDAQSEGPEPSKQQPAKEQTQKPAEDGPEFTGAPRPPKEIALPTGPAPKKVVIEDPREGFGPPIEPEQKFIAQYVAINLNTGKEVENYWTDEPFKWCWRTGMLSKGWEIGLAGMRVGGKRELTVPSKLAYDTGPLFYVIELLDLGPRPGQAG